MQIVRSGVILFVEKYAECVEFYAGMLLLPVWYEKSTLTCFRFGQSYLMVKRGGLASTAEKTRSQSPALLRINVADVDAECAALRERGLDSAAVTRFAWGSVVHLVDPDGNGVEFCQWPSDAGLPPF